MGRISTFVVAFIPPPHSLPGFSFSSGFVCFPSTVPFPLTYCAYVFIPATYRPSLQKFWPLTFNMKGGKIIKMTECGYHCSPLRSFHSAWNEMIDTYDDDHLKAVEKRAKGVDFGGIFNRGLTSCCCYLFLYCFPPPATTGWMDMMDPYNLVITQCDSAIGDRSEHKTFCKPQNNPLCTPPPY